MCVKKLFKLIAPVNSGLSFIYGTTNARLHTLSLEKPGRRPIFQHSIDPKHTAKGATEEWHRVRGHVPLFSTGLLDKWISTRPLRRTNYWCGWTFVCVCFVYLNRMHELLSQYWRTVYACYSYRYLAGHVHVSLCLSVCRITVNDAEVGTGRILM